MITDALDATGPAIRVLADQTDELVGMLTSLDRLGVVGTRVINASRSDLLRSLRDLAPVLNRLTAAGKSLAPGLNLLVSFPFPQEASEIVRGDYANTSIRMDVNIANLYSGLGLPEIDLGDTPAGPVVDQLVACLESGNIASAACRRVLRDPALLRQLRAACEQPRNRSNPVCRVVNLPGGGGGPSLPSLPSLPGLGGALGLGRLDAALTSGTASPAPSPSALYGGAA